MVRKNETALKNDAQKLFAFSVFSLSCGLDFLFSVFGIVIHGKDFGFASSIGRTRQVKLNDAPSGSLDKGGRQLGRIAAQHELSL
jgi:hypothetical protein